MSFAYGSLITMLEKRICKLEKELFILRNRLDTPFWEGPVA